MCSRRFGLVPDCMRSQAEAGSGENARVIARGEPASYAKTIRGGRSGPSAANASTVSATALNTVGATTGAGTASRGLRMAPLEQQDAQALHFCWTASLPGDESVEAAEAEPASSACAAMSWCPPELCAGLRGCDWSADAASWATVAATPPWWFGPQETIVAATAPCAESASAISQINSVRIIFQLYRSRARPALEPRVDRAAVLLDCITQ